MIRVHMTSGKTFAVVGATVGGVSRVIEEITQSEKSDQRYLVFPELVVTLDNIEAIEEIRHDS